MKKLRCFNCRDAQGMRKKGQDGKPIKDCPFCEKFNTDSKGKIINVRSTGKVRAK